MKQILLVSMLAILFVACESKESKAIKTYTESGFMDHPGIKITYEELRQDSIHTVGDSLNILYAEYCRDINLKDLMDEYDYILDSMSVTQFTDSCIALLQDIRAEYRIDLKEAIKELDEYYDAVNVTSTFGLNSIFGACGVDLNNLEEKLKTKIRNNKEIITDINSLFPLFQNMKALGIQAKEDVLIEFWYCQYTIKDRSLPIFGERRHFERIHLKKSKDEVKIIECISLNSRGEVQNNDIFDF